LYRDLRLEYNEPRERLEDVQQSQTGRRASKIWTRKGHCVMPMRKFSGAAKVITGSCATATRVTREAVTREVTASMAGKGDVRV